MTAELRVGVVGAGRMGRRHLDAWPDVAGTRLVGLADPDPDAAAEADRRGCVRTIDVHALLDRTRPDVVSIAVPTPLHHPVATAVLDRGISCLVEKPLASTTAEADELIALARARGAVLAVGHTERHNPMVRALAAVIGAGTLGTVGSVMTSRVGPLPRPLPITDVLTDLAVHDVDVVSHLLGRQPTHAVATGSRTEHPTEIDAAELSLDYGEASALIRVSWTAPARSRTLTVGGTAGLAVGDYVTQELLVGDRSGVRVVSAPRADPLRAELGALALAVRTGDPALVVDPRDARDAVAVVTGAIARR